MAKKEKKINLPTTTQLTNRKSKNSKFYSTSWKCKMSDKEMKKWLEVMCYLMNLLGVTSQQEILLKLTIIEHQRETQYQEIKTEGKTHIRSKLLLDRVRGLI